MEHNVTSEMKLKIYAAYLGSNIQYKDKSTAYTGVKGNTPWSKQVCLEISPNLWTYEYECKLLLRPLEDIADVDAIEVAKILNKEYELIKSPEQSKMYNSLGITHEVSDEKKLSNIGKRELQIMIDAKRYAHDVCDYLRPKSYDCGYSNIPSLITAGIAIKIKR